MLLFSVLQYGAYVAANNDFNNDTGLFYLF